ncbi:phage uncharacterized protein, partial [Wolbachia endosymbiont of Drosophila ananassae]
SGKVFLPHQAVWLNDFEYEILMFLKLDTMIKWIVPCNICSG